MPYDSIAWHVQGKLPRFSIFRRFIDIFKNSNKIKLILRRNQTLMIEANGNFDKHFTIFNNLKVIDYTKRDEEIYNGPPISTVVEQKKIAQWLHSIAFPSVIHLHCVAENNKHFKLFFRIRDDILGHFVLAADYEDDDEEVSTSD